MKWKAHLQGFKELFAKQGVSHRDSKTNKQTKKNDGDYGPQILRLAAAFLQSRLPSLAAQVSLPWAPGPEKKGGTYSTPGTVHKSSLHSRDRERKDKAHAPKDGMVQIRREENNRKKLRNLPQGRAQG